MTQNPLYVLTLAFAVATGSAAGILSLLTWQVFRRSEFGKAVFVLSITLSAFTIYHALVLTWGAEPFLVEVLESLVYTGVAGFIVVMLRLQTRIPPTAEGRRDSR